MESYPRRRNRYFWLMAVGYLLLLSVLCITRFNLLSLLIGQAPSSHRSINLVPFRSILQGWRQFGRLGWESFGNLVMFVPLGVLFCYRWQKNTVFVATICCLFSSVFIEICQFFLKTGAADVDDVLLNTVGGLIGVALFSLVRRFAHGNWQDTRQIISVIATIFPPFLLFYIVDFVVRTKRYSFSLWHFLLIALYFVPAYFFLLKDLSRKTLIFYFASVGLFSVYFFAVFL